MRAKPMDEDLFTADTALRLHNASDGPSVELLRATLTASGTGVFFYPLRLSAAGDVIVTGVGSQLAWSLNLDTLLGVDPATDNIENFLACVHPLDRISVRDELAKAIERGASRQDCAYRVLGSDGKIRWIMSRYLIGRDDLKQLQYIAGVCFDITARKELEEQLQHANEQLRIAQNYLQTALKASGIAIYRHFFGNDETKASDLSNGTWNYNIAPMYGHPEGTVMTPELMMSQIDPEDIKELARRRQEAFQEGLTEWQIECRVKIDANTHRWLLIKSNIERNEQGDPHFISGAVIDITERKRAEERIQYLATHDELTGLPNRAMFSNLLNLTVESAKRYSRKFAVLFIDLDRFKSINDALGHQAGDVLLQEVAKRLRSCVRAGDIVARLSGDEFVVLIQEIDIPADAGTCARKIITEIMRPMTLNGQECRVTASVGISLFPEGGTDEQTLLKHADIAMYQAKEDGKNTFQFFSSSSKSHTLQRMVLENELRSALEKNELSLQYQAKLDLRTNNINGVEALLRWNNPQFGLVSPAQFIPIAEESGLIVPIGRWVLKTACAQNMAWQAQGLAPVCVAVNLSPRQFLNEDLLIHIKDALDESGMRPEHLELEITESMVMHNVDQAVQLLHAIKGLGVRIAIDDFGTGYSSLAQLKRFPIDTLKVDRSFIREVVEDRDDQAITEAIIAMGKSLSLTIVAEGVETREQQTFLRQRACDEMQGYYFSRPVDAGDFADLLSTHRCGSPTSEA